MLTLEFDKTKIRAAYKNRKGTFIEEFDKRDYVGVRKFTKNFRRAFVILKCEKIYTRFESYPLGKREIAALVQTNKRGYFPVDISRYNFAYKINGSKVALGAVSAEAVDVCLKFLKSLNISCAGVGVAVYEYANALAASGNSILFVKTSERDAAAAFLQNGLKSVRNVAFDDFSFSLKQAFGITDFSSIEKVYLTGEAPEIKNLFPAAETVDFIPVEKISLNFLPKTKNKLLAAILIIFSAALALFAGAAFFKTAANGRAKTTASYASEATLDLLSATVTAAGNRILFESISCDAKGFNAKCRAENESDARDFLEEVRAAEDNQETFQVREFRNDGDTVTFTITFSNSSTLSSNSSTLSATFSSR